jgi:hypothetical protein
MISTQRIHNNKDDRRSLLYRRDIGHAVLPELNVQHS